MRRTALLLADDDVLQERWHAETDPGVRLPLLPALGARAATTAGAPRTGSPGGRDRFTGAVEAVLSRVLRDDEPVMKVAAVVARASLDRDAPLRHADLLLDVLADPAARPRSPYLLFALHAGLPVALVLVTVATLGYASGLLLQDRLMALPPDELSGQALGLHSSGMLTMQGLGAVVAGSVTDLTSPAIGIVVTAAASLTTTLLLAPGLRRGRTAGRDHLRRHYAAA